MTLAAAFSSLRDRLHALDEMTQQLGLTVGDAPEDGVEPAIVEALRAQAAELEHQVATAVQAFDRHGAEAAADCQQTVVRVWRAVQFELASYESLAELQRVGAERGGAWQRWTAVVREVLERCAWAVYETADAFADCWREAAGPMHTPGGITHV